MKICNKCVLSEASPNIEFDAQGVCSRCRNTGAAPARWLSPEELEQFLGRFRGQSQYDCLVACSGGKDSTAALYYAVTEYKLKPLVFHFDQGFVQEEATANVEAAARVLNLDLQIYRSRELYEPWRILAKDARRWGLSFCGLCWEWHQQLLLRTADAHGIGFILTGASPGQAQENAPLGWALLPDQEVRRQLLRLRRKAGGGSRFAALFSRGQNLPSMYHNPGFKRFYEENLAGDPRYSHLAPTLFDAYLRCKRVIRMYSPYQLGIRWSADQQESLLRDKLEWKPLPVSYPKGSTNCRMKFLEAFLHVFHNGMEPYHAEELSVLIRRGLLSREAAIRQLQVDFDPSCVEEALSVLGLGWQDIGVPERPASLKDFYRGPENL